MGHRAPNLDRNILRADNRTVPACGHVRIEPPFEPRDNVRVVPQVSARGERVIGVKARVAFLAVLRHGQAFAREAKVAVLRAGRSRLLPHQTRPAPSVSRAGRRKSSRAHDLRAMTRKVSALAAPAQRRFRASAARLSGRRSKREALLSWTVMRSLTVVVQGGYLTSRDDCVALIGPSVQDHALACEQRIRAG